MLFHFFGHRNRFILLAVVIAAVASWPLTGCGDKSQEGKTPEMDKAFKGGPPPPEVQREMEKGMAQLKQRGRPQTPAAH